MGFFDTSSGLYWADATIWKAAEDLPVEKVGLGELDLRMRRFPADRICDMAMHYRRIRDADLSVPIILSPRGVIIDGAHRVVKAMTEKVFELPCKRLKEMPTPDGKPKIGGWKRVG